MVCRYCGAAAPPQSNFCSMCGKSLTEQEKPRRGQKKRGNGQGTVYKRGEKYIAEKTLGYYIDAAGKLHRRAVRKTFEKKKDAVAALPTLAPERSKTKISFQAAYFRWADTLTTGKSTRNCYSAAMHYFEPLFGLPAAEVDIDDLQECMDNCPRGRRTKENMKTAVGLMYKFGIPRGYFPEKLNLAEFLKINADESGFDCKGLPTEYLATIKKAVGKVAGADIVTAHCFLGFRPSELLALKLSDYNAAEKMFIGGAKTDAGKNRFVTISPKIQPIVDSFIGRNTEQFFCGPDGRVMGIKEYRSLFYNVLETLGLKNPIIVDNGISRHTYTPHSCRHTFATMLKRVDGAAADKLKLIGHTTDEMLRHYQDSPAADLRILTDKIG